MPGGVFQTTGSRLPADRDRLSLPERSGCESSPFAFRGIRDSAQRIHDFLFRCVFTRGFRGFPSDQPACDEFALELTVFYLSAKGVLDEAAERFAFSQHAFCFVSKVWRDSQRRNSCRFHGVLKCIAYAMHCTSALRYLQSPETRLNRLRLRSSGHSVGSVYHPSSSIRTAAENFA